MWPISGRVERFLAGRFQTQEEVESRPRYLDKTVLALPHIAAQALTKEVGRIRDMTVSAVREVLAGEPAHGRPRSTYVVAQSLANAVGSYSAALSRTALPADIASLLPTLIRATQQFTTVLQNLTELESVRATIGTIENDAVKIALSDFQRAAGIALDRLGAASTDPAAESPQEAMEALEHEFGRLKKCALDAAAVGQLPVATMDGVLRYSTLLRRIDRQLRKASDRLASVQALLDLDTKGNVVRDDTDEAQEEMPDAA